MGSLILSVGRCLASNDVPVDNASVSRRHLNIQVHDLQTIDLHDCGSSNGSWYWNGHSWESFRDIRLSANDYIVIGDAKLRIMEIIIAYQVRARSQVG